MRRSDREVTSLADILDILRRADTIRLGLCGGKPAPDVGGKSAASVDGANYPYVVPLSFGFEAVGDKIMIYFHGAGDGHKHDLLCSDDRVCVEADILHRYVRMPTGITAEYESVIGFGRASQVTGGEAVKGLALILEHCGFGGLAYDPAMLDVTAVYKVELATITGKRRASP